MSDAHIRSHWDAALRHALVPALVVSVVIFAAGCVGFLT